MIVFLLYLIGFVFAAAAILSVAAGWRLSQGPAKISFLTPLLQESATGLPPGWSLDIGDSYVNWDGENQSLQIRVSDVSFVNPDQQRTITIPNAGFSFHGDALLKGRVEPREIVAEGINLLLTRDKGNAFRLGIGRADDESLEENPLAAQTQRDLAAIASDIFGRDVGDGKQPGRLGRLNALTLSDTSVTVVDNIRNAVYRFDASQLKLKNTDSGIDLRTTASFHARELTVPLRISLVYRPELDSVRGAVRFPQIRLPELVASLDAPEIFLGLDFPVSGTLGFQASKTNGLGAMPLKVEIGQGTFALPGKLEGPLNVDRAALSAVIHPSTQRLDIDELVYDSGQFVAQAQGTTILTDEGPNIQLNIVSTDVPLTLVPTYWPPSNGSEVRSWLAEHVKAGRADIVRARLNLTPQMWRKDVPDADSFDVSFDFRDADVVLYPPFQPIKSASGSLNVTGRALRINLTAGKITELDLSGGVLTIDNFAKDAPILATEFVAKSTLQGAARSILRGSLDGSVVTAEALSGISGTMAARVSLNIPISSSTRLEDAKFVANANLANVRAAGLVPDLTLSAQSLNLKLDPSGAEVQGVVSAGQSVFDIQWVERFSDQVPFFRQVAFDGEADIADAQNFAPDIARYIAGQVGARGTVYFDRSGLMTMDIATDLAKAAAQVEMLNWYKPVGQPGILNFQLAREPNDAITVSKIRANGEGLNVIGDVNLTPEGNLASLRLERADLGPNRTSVVVRGDEAAEGKGPYAIQIVGKQLDLSPWISPQTNTDTPLPEWVNGSTIDLAVDRLILDKDLFVQDAVADLKLVDPFPVGVIRGALNGRAGVSARGEIKDEGWKFTVTSPDAGSVLAALGQGEAINGGTVRIHGTMAEDRSIQGVGTISKFSLTETPTFARLFSLASFTGIGEALSGDGLSFTEAQLPFRYHEGRMDFAKARMAGPSVGVTADGFLDLRNNKVRSVGNLIPAYSLSQVLGAIPLLGTILGGDQGLFGVTYAVEGPLTKPKITVNPLSALAPGILRRMFLEPVEWTEFEDIGPEGRENER